MKCNVRGYGSKNEVDMCMKYNLCKTCRKKGEAVNVK